jgi:branched-chain amino acid aminotransferase
VYFEQVCACGTAVVITPVGSITHGEKVYTMGSSGAEAGASAGPVSKQLYSTMRAIQNGEEQGPEGWIVKV